MSIAAAKRVEDCFDGSSIFSYELNQSWDYPAIQRLVALGRLEYFSNFPRPFFRVTHQNGLVIKGVEGEITCRVIYPATNKEVVQQAVEAFLSDL